MGFSTSFYDPGRGGQRGGTAPKKGATIGICERCGAKQYVAKNAWFRACRPACSACGGYLEPSASAHERLFERSAEAS